MSNVNRIYVEEREVKELIESSLAPIKSELKNIVTAIEANTTAIQKNATDVKPWREAYQTANNVQKFSLWIAKFSVPMAIVGLIVDRVIR
jgi:alpha/beta superfamily hydrolase